MFLRHIRSALFAGRNTLNASSYRQARKSTAKRVKKPMSILSSWQLEEILRNPAVKPASPRNAYNLFVAEYSKKLGNDNSQPSSTGKGREIMKLCGEKWKLMSEDEKKRFADLAAAGKDSKQESLDEYRSTMNSLVKVKDIIIALKNLTTAAKEERGNLKKMSPVNLFMKSENNDRLPMAEIAKRWRELDDEKKAEYKAAVEKSNKEVENSLREWRRKWKIIAVDK